MFQTSQSLGHLKGLFSVAKRPKLWKDLLNVPNFGTFETSFLIGETSVYLYCIPWQCWHPFLQNVRTCVLKQIEFKFDVTILHIFCNPLTDRGKRHRPQPELCQPQHEQCERQRRRNEQHNEQVGHREIIIPLPEGQWKLYRQRDTLSCPRAAVDLRICKSVKILPQRLYCANGVRLRRCQWHRLCCGRNRVLPRCSHGRWHPQWSGMEFISVSAITFPNSKSKFCYWDFNVKWQIQGVPSARGPGLLYSDFECSTVCPILFGLMGIWQKRLGSSAWWWNTKINQPNPGHELMGHPVE